MTEQPENHSFSTLGITPKFLGILTALGFTTPTPIQHKAIPIAITGSDIIGVAQTGTGKTLAFGIPMIQRIAQNGGQGLVMLPTRELALQVDEVLQRVGRQLNLRTAVLIGGASMGQQLQSMRRKPHIIIATPCRLIDHLEQKNLTLSDMKIVVLDEADRMLDMGFAPQIKKILNVLPAERQMLLFSATMPKDIVQLATTYMKLPLQIEIAPQGTLAKRVDQELVIVRKEDKMRLLDTIINQHQRTILIFTRTKRGASRACEAINHMGHRAAEIHSNRSLAQRKEALAGFKSGKYRVLVATDIAARGIDVTDIELVINYDLPDDAEDYVHRIGRTGRAGLTGKAISFVTSDQKGKVREIERLTRMTFNLQAHPELAPHRDLPMKSSRTSYNEERQQRYQQARRSPQSSRPSHPSRPSGSRPPSRGPRSGADRRPGSRPGGQSQNRNRQRSY